MSDLVAFADGNQRQVYETNFLKFSKYCTMKCVVVECTVALLVITAEIKFLLSMQFLLPMRYVFADGRPGLTMK